MPPTTSRVDASLGRLVTRIRARGWRETAAATFSEYSARLSSTGILVVLRRDGAHDLLSLPGLRLVRATPADASVYARDIGTDSAATFRARLSDATSCFFVKEGDRVVHATWVSTRAAWIGELNRCFRVPSGDAYLYESYTRPEQRGRGIYPFALRSIAHTLAASGVAHLWIAAVRSNRSSLRAMEKAGFEPRFEIGYQWRLGRAQIRLPPGASGLLKERCHS